MIRPYSENDKSALIQLIRLNTPQYFDTTEEAYLINYLENERESYFVVEESGGIVGCGGINYEDNFTVGIISWDIIHPDFQGKGIGKNLLAYRIEKIKKNKNIEKIIVRTSQHTDKFYEKGGFKLDRIEKDYWAKGFDLYQMEIILTNKNA